MSTTKAVFKQAWPYQQDKMALPVQNCNLAVSFYEHYMGFNIVEYQSGHYPAVILQRDDVQIGLCENGGDPTQDGCFFEVDDLVSLLNELTSSGLQKEISNISFQNHGDSLWKVFFVTAPDGLCYCFGERQPTS
ncbi:MAG: VOC family protein [Spirosomataceae bacterium]